MFDKAKIAVILGGAVVLQALALGACAPLGTAGYKEVHYYPKSMMGLAGAHRAIAEVTLLKLVEFGKWKQWEAEALLSPTISSICDSSSVGCIGIAGQDERELLYDCYEALASSSGEFSEDAKTLCRPIIEIE